LATATGTAGETAAAKIRRVLPSRIADRLDAVLESLSFTTEPGVLPAPQAEVLLAVADAVRHHRPVSLQYTTGDDRRRVRTLHPFGLVNHAGRWYVTGVDPELGEDRTFRLDRMAEVRALPGSFEPPAGDDAAERLLTSMARAPYRHEVTLRVRGTLEQIRTRLPASVAEVRKGEDEGWQDVEIRAESLEWLPAALAGLDLPFVIERPDELRNRVVALADRLAASARRGSTG
jgi:predicted DNA-binding transcriptional regulator YafY